MPERPTVNVDFLSGEYTPAQIIRSRRTARRWRPRTVWYICFRTAEASLWERHLRLRSSGGVEDDEHTHVLQSVYRWKKTESTSSRWTVKNVLDSWKDGQSFQQIRQLLHLDIDHRLERDADRHHIWPHTFELAPHNDSAVYRKSEVDFGILPFPKYDKTQKEYISLDWRGLMCVQITIERTA